MKVSVIIPFREESGELLERKIKKLKEGSFKDFEIIVVDDSSPFPAEEITKKFPDVKLKKLENTPPFNMANARNEGAKIADGEFLMFTDVDIEITSDDIQKLLKEADEDVVFGTMKVEGGPLRYGITAFSLIKKDFFERIGGFDERFVGNYGYDDTFLEWKILKIKKKIKVVEDVTVKTVRKDKGTYDPNRASLTEHNLKLFQELTSSYKWVPLIPEIVNYEGFLTEEDIQILGHYATEAKKGILEIGSYAGKSALVFLRFSEVPLYCIDSYRFNDPRFGKREEIRRKFLDNVVDAYPQRVKFIERPSDSAGEFVGEFDLLFIDGDHSYEQVRRDFLNYSRKMEAGDFIIFHDYRNSDYPGVAQCVDELVKEGLVIPVLLNQGIAVVRKG